MRARSGVPSPPRWNTGIPRNQPAASWNAPKPDAHAVICSTVPSNSLPKPGEYLWQAGENAWVVIDDRYMRAARVGGTMITLGVTDLDDILSQHEPVEVLDPDGNSLSLAEMPAQ
jgi:hypothetical protein